MPKPVNGRCYDAEKRFDKLLSRMLVQVSSFPLSAMFGMCTFFLFVCVLCQRRLEGLVHPEKDYQLVDSTPSSSLQAGGKGAASAEV